MGQKGMAISRGNVRQAELEEMYLREGQGAEI